MEKFRAPAPASAPEKARLRALAPASVPGPWSVKKKKNIFIDSNTNHHREMKLVLINMDYCQLQFDALKFF